jgi:hypothetical protein
VRSDQSLGLFTRLLVVAAHLRQMGRPRFFLKLQSFVELGAQFFSIVQASSGVVLQLV